MDRGSVVDRFFKSWFHCFDATVILASFLVDVCLKGPLEQAGSIVVVLRLWRVFKIIEELGAQASDQLDELKEQVTNLQTENRELYREKEALRQRFI